MIRRVLARLRRFLTFPHIGDALLLIGLICLAVSGVLSLIELGSGRTAHAEGVIVGFSDPPVVQFVPRDKVDPVQFTSTMSTTYWNAGDHLEVAYNPDNPHDARIDGLRGRWWWPVIFGALAVLSLAAGAICTLMAREFVRRWRRWRLRRR
jgi:hypothetical protein